MSLNLNAIMDAVGVRLRTIGDLRVYDYPPEAVAAPAAVVGFPDQIRYDQTFAGGVHALTMTITVMVSGVSDRASRDALSAYADSTGGRSVKAAVDGTLDGAVKDACVGPADFITVEVGGVGYPAASFTVEVYA